MDIRKISIGVIVLTLGVVVPLHYHAVLIDIATRSGNYSYSHDMIVRRFSEIPWILWPYLIAMTFIGFKLVTAGLKSSDSNSE